MSKFAGNLNLAPLLLATMVVALITVNHLDIVRANEIDDIFNKHMKQILDAWKQKCTTKKVYTAKEAKELDTGCIDPLMNSAKFILYKEAVSECIEKFPDTTNLCEPEETVKFGKCGLRLLMSIFTLDKEVLEENSKQFLQLIGETLTKCLPEFEA